MKNLAKFSCEYCNIKTNNKYDYEIHLTTSKHLRNSAKSANCATTESFQVCEPIINIDDKCYQNIGSQNKDYICLCGKKYLYSSGLCKHKKRCSKGQQEEQSQPINQTDLILFLMKENKEFKELLIEQNAKIIELAKEGKTINNNTINNKFNMNVFLNEQCSNALNIMDFISQLKLQLSDLEAMETLGYVNGITSIFVRGLKELDVTKRPIHCSDLKREVIYIKDNGVWMKDDENKPKMKKAIQHIAGKNLRQMKEWRETYPEWVDCKSKKNEQYMIIMNKSCGGIDDAENERFFNKIIKNVAKEVLINKLN